MEGVADYTFAVGERKPNLSFFSYTSLAGIIRTVHQQTMHYKPLFVVAILMTGIAFSLTPQTGGMNTDASQMLLSQPLTIRWRYESSTTLNLTPASDSERIYLPLAGGTIVSLKAKDGQLYWRSDMGGELSASPAADESMI